MYKALTICLFTFLALSASPRTVAQSQVGSEDQGDGLQGSRKECCSTTDPSSVTAHRDTPASPSEASSKQTGQLPSAPSATLEGADPQVHFEWQLGIPVEDQARSAPRLPVWDKKMWAAHMVLASSMIFDVEVTHAGIAHHRCEEGNSDLHKHPSRGELYVDNLLQFVPITVMDWLAAKAARNGHIGRWFWKPLGYMDPAWGSVIHFRGGAKWLTNCW